MSTSESAEELATRLEKVEGQLHNLKALLWVVVFMLLCLIIPPLRIVAGFALLCFAIVFAVVELIRGVMWLLD